MTVSGITSNPSTSYSNVSLASSTATRTAKKTLGQEDFLKLLATQFQSQDPMKPMEDTAFIAQMAQFSSLEQSNSLVKEMALMRADQNLLTANSYLGRSITVEDENGDPVTGIATAVAKDSSSGITLTINGKSYSLNSVRRIEPVVISSPTAVTSDPAQPAA